MIQLPRFALLTLAPLFALFAISLTACNSTDEDCPNGSSTDFPQYGGTYELESYDYNPASCASLATDEDQYAQCKAEHNLIKKAPPRVLTVKHRMEWDENFWRHRLLFQSVASPADPLAAQGSYAVDLASLTGKGSALRAAKVPPGGIDQVSAFCTFKGYSYTVSATNGSIVPEPELLKEIYWSSAPLPLDADGNPINLGSPTTDPNGSSMRLVDSENACVEPAGVEEWKRQIETKQGAVIRLRLSKRANGDYSGCFDFGEGIIPLSDNAEDKGDITLTYRRLETSTEYDVDLRSEGFDDVPAYVEHPSLMENIAAFE